ncbi:hypothetical protein F469_04858 [Pseudomonas sp. URMO17WK12:I2]|nr:hypothetical protein F469_04858 [Pseudomonas sp. URMO17WK12:I2]
MKSCGIDLHSNNSVVVVTDEADRILLTRRCPNDLAKGKGDRFIFDLDLV